MPRSEKKSIAYFIFIICLVLIGAPSLYAIIWQPSFGEGYISIPFGRGSLIFPLWKFVAECLALVLFSYQVYRTVKSSFRRRPFRLSTLFGIAVIGFCLLLFRDFAYTETSFGPLYEDHPPPSFAWPILLIITIVVFTLCILFVKRKKVIQRAASRPT